MAERKKQWFFYLFESAGIQQYIFDGGKLAEMVGASELLELLLASDGPLDQALNELGLTEESDYFFSRRGGGGFGLFFLSKSEANIFRRLWRLIVPGYIPGLEFQDALEVGGDQCLAFARARETLHGMKQLPPCSLPEAGPLVIRAPRTGRPAVRLRPESVGKQVWVDAASDAKLGPDSSNQKRERELLKGKRINLETKFLPNASQTAESDGRLYRFPRNLESDVEDDRYGMAFPFNSRLGEGGKEHTVVGVIHADGNGLGQILMKLEAAFHKGDGFADAMYEFSQGIELATVNAVKVAMEKVILKHAFGEKYVLPIRPLILGGDDLTVIVRADLAMDFCQTYLKEFEDQTEKVFSSFRGALAGALKSENITKMSACAGIAYIRASQPFYLGYGLCESLCKHAKQTSKRVSSDRYAPPASLAFYKVKSTFIDKYTDLVEREMRMVHENGDKFQLTLGAYGVNGQGSLPQIDDLKLVETLFRKREMARGPGRHLQTLLYSDLYETERVWNAWRNNMKTSTLFSNELINFDQIANRLITGFGTGGLPFGPQDGAKLRKSFLGDLYGMMASNRETINQEVLQNE